MIRYLKPLGLAIAASIVLSGFTASAALAEEAFTSSASPTTVTGGQTTEHKFTTNVGNWTCETAHFEGTFVGVKVNELTIHPTYTGCFLSGTGIAITVNTSDDNYTFTTPANKVGIVDITGTGGIIISGPGCTITISNQSIGQIIYSNQPGGDALFTWQETNIHYSWFGFLCGSGTATNGTYTGTSLINGGANNISID